jgi:hypothetical protein
MDAGTSFGNGIAGFGIAAVTGTIGAAGAVGRCCSCCCMGVTLGDFGYFVTVAVPAGRGALSPLYMGTVVAAAEALAVAAVFWVVTVDVGASFFCIGMLGVFVFVTAGSSRGRPPANVIKDKQTRQRRNAV